MLVFGAADNGYERTNTADTLRTLGSNVQEESSLPDDLSAYSSVWHISAYDQLDSRSVSALAAYIAAGGSVYVTGERPCCEPLNSGAQSLSRRVLKDQDVTIGGLGDINGPFTFNPKAKGGATTSPYTLVDFTPQSPGGLSGIGNIDSANVFASNGSIAVGAVWDESDMSQGKGRLAILMDIDYLKDENRTPVLANIQNFLTNGIQCSPNSGNSLVTWTSTLPANCSVITTPQQVDFRASVSQGTISLTFSSPDIDPKCQYFDVAPTSAALLCDLENAPVTGARFTVTAETSESGRSSRFYTIYPKNDPRNVPTGQSVASNWWEWPDADGDGLPDLWEQAGVWVKNKFVDLPGMGALPGRKTVLLMVEAQAGFAYSDQTIDYVKKAFAEAPVGNPASTDGIDLVVKRGNEGIPASVIGDFSDLGRENLQRICSYSGFAKSELAGGNGVPQLFKWMLNWDSFARDGGTLITGNSYVKAGFGWTSIENAFRGAHPDINAAATKFSQAVNLMHEFGHQLGLNHHGMATAPDNDRRYRSIMSYPYSIYGVRFAQPNSSRTYGRIDYSRYADVNYDWQLGQAEGKLTLMQGQYGEVPDFYSRSFNEAFLVDGEDKGDVHTDSEMTAALEPTYYADFAGEFGFEPTLQFPGIKGPLALSVGPQGSATAQYDLMQGGSGPASIEVVTQPAHGTVSVNGSSLTYTSSGPTIEEDRFEIRAFDGKFGSDVIEVVVAGQSTPPAPNPGSGSSAIPWGS
ncbi:hypothetical protein GCM10007304_48800 [Rhodococcoides trifolii]|uniref:Uncharacterized protein n=1 Tax=Rhodococcoides trifolii TaxID=908250 RepID=A0A917LJ72_9NOCA|nr:hypothetical protein GCM10007304_48800 [Rhodococcus trifolii]